jgi:hypothetical protein
MLTDKIEAVIAILKSPVSAEQAAEGWTDEAKQGILLFFDNLLKDVKNEEEVKYVGLVRGLDAWGIEPGGVLYEQAMEIARELNSENR